MTFTIRRISHYEITLASHQFDFSVINTTVDDCEQQVPSVALYLQQLTTLAMRRQQLWSETLQVGVAQQAVLIIAQNLNNGCERLAKDLNTTIE